MKIDFTKSTAENLEYSKEKGFGFISASLFYPHREVLTDRIRQSQQGVEITVNAKDRTWRNANDYNYNGLLFRWDLGKPGAYRIWLTINSDPDETEVSVSNLNGERIRSLECWDAAGLIPKRCIASWKDKVWEFTYVSADGTIVIEVEPRLSTLTKPESHSVTVGIAGIEIVYVENQVRELREKPTIYTLGDSTVKSYVYEEAIMSGWGQIFDDLFDLSQVRVMNYSMGGRSVKNIYEEGRINDLLLDAKEGDYLLLQSGHNDESRGEEKGPDARFGRGNTEQTYRDWIEQYYVPAAKARGVKLIFVTPMTRIDKDRTTDQELFFGGFQYGSNPGIHFPGILAEMGKSLQIPVVDLYERSLLYLNEIGPAAARAMFLGVEAGETPGKTNSGSYANGNPTNACDGTHFKEALAKQWAAIVAEELYNGNMIPEEWLKKETKEAFHTKDWYCMFPEMAKDVQTGKDAYYRNQIEKMIKHKIMEKDENGCFYPQEPMYEAEFEHALKKLWGIEKLESDKKNVILTRSRMAKIILSAYDSRFGKNDKGQWCRPVYMTDYNGTNLSPQDPNYDPNLDGESAQYYPLVPWNHIKDRDEISKEDRPIVKEVYELGLMRSEQGIERGKMKNGCYFEPEKIVTREKAAKELFFLSVLVRDIYEESDK